MPDNPRNPEYRSDIPSSRNASTETPAPGSSSGGGYSAPSSSGGSPPKVHVKNLAIGALVTVVTSTIVFLITQYLKKPEGEGETVKKATTAAWNSFVGYENIYTENLLSLSNRKVAVSLDSVLLDIKQESSKFQRDVEDLSKNNKKVDKDLVKVFNRRLENERTALSYIEKYYTNLGKIYKSEAPLNQKKDAIADEMARYNEYVKDFYERSLNDVKVIADILSKRYDQRFAMNDFKMVELYPEMMRKNDSAVNAIRELKIDSSGNIAGNTSPAKIVKEKDLIGHWNSDGDVFSFEKNGRMGWVLSGGQKAVGMWSIEDNQLRLDGEIVNLKQKGFWKFFVSDITSTSLTLTSVKGNYVYHLVKIVTQ